MIVVIFGERLQNRKVFGKIFEPGKGSFQRLRPQGPFSSPTTMIASRKLEEEDGLSNDPVGLEERPALNSG
jgi:hypothetical protein